MAGRVIAIVMCCLMSGGGLALPILTDHLLLARQLH